MSIIKPFTGVDDRRKLAHLIPLDAPFTLNVFPANACNFRCVYCVHAMDKESLESRYAFKRDMMSMDTFNKIVSQAERFTGEVRLVSFMGQGEPLLNKALPSMIAAAKRARIAKRVDVVTNASLLSGSLTDELLDAGLDVLRVSLQGLSSAKYRAIAQVDLDFCAFLANLEYFFEKSRGRCQLYVKVLDVSLEQGQRDLFYRTFDRISDRMFVEEVKPVYAGVDYGPYEMSLATDRRGLKHEKRLVCPQPFYVLSIWPNGDVIPCSAIHKVSCLGNVNEGKLVDMWNSTTLRSFQLMQLRKLRNQHPQCRCCCAPDDCAHPEDILDAEADDLLARLESLKPA
jgi:GTP 3',8-cyclase